MSLKFGKNRAVSTAYVKIPYRFFLFSCFKYKKKDLEFNKLLHNLEL